MPLRFRLFPPLLPSAPFRSGLPELWNSVTVTDGRGALGEAAGFISLYYLNGGCGAAGGMLLSLPHPINAPHLRSLPKSATTAGWFGLGDESGGGTKGPTLLSCTRQFRSVYLLVAAVKIPLSILVL